MHKKLIVCVTFVIVVTLCASEGAPQWEESWSKTLRKQQKEKSHSNLQDPPIWDHSHHQQLSADQIRSDDIRVNSDESVSLAEIVSVGQKTSKLYHETDPGVARNGHQKMNIMTSRADHHRSDMYNLPVGEDDFTNKISKYD